MTQGYSGSFFFPFFVGLIKEEIMFEADDDYFSLNYAYSYNE